MRKKKVVDYLRPDGKTQVMVKYEDDTAVAVEKVLISTHHAPGQSQAAMKDDIFELVVKHVLPEEFLSHRLDFIFNPSGNFEVGGPVADIVVFAHAALPCDRAGSSPGRGFPNTRFAIHDANRRGTNRTPKHDSLLMSPGITVRLRFSIARTLIRAHCSALIIERLAIQL